MNIRFRKCLKLGERFIGPDHPLFVVAEAGVNHNGSIKLARRLVDQAAHVGADAIKFQAFNSSELVTSWAPKADCQRGTRDTSQLDMLRKLELRQESFAELKGRCEDKGLEFLATPFDEGSAEHLRQIGVRAFKIGSGDLTNIPLISAVAEYHLPMILSTGMGSMSEVRLAVDAIALRGVRELCLLHCTSQYPARPEEVNLRAMHMLHKTFGCPVGYSDHTLLPFLPVLALGMGACVIEKHFTLSRDLKGPDHAASLEPREFAEMVKQLRSAETVLGSEEKGPTESEMKMRDIARRSIVARRKIAPGEVLARDDIAFRRPGTGIPPSELNKVLGRRAKRGFERDELISREGLEE